jgi:hypothetical protein
LDPNSHRRAPPADVPDHLDPMTMQGTCGFGSEQVAESLLRAGVPSEHIFVVQANDISKLPGERHQFIVYVRPDGVDMLMDTTFAQFTGPRHPQVEALLASGVGAQLRHELLGKGYTVLTDEVANVYLSVVSQGRQVPAVRATDFKLAKANLARDMSLLPSDRVPQAIDSDRTQRLPPPPPGSVPVIVRSDAPKPLRSEIRADGPTGTHWTIGGYEVVATRHLQGTVLNWRIWGLGRIAGPTTDVGGINRFVAILLDDGAGAGAAVLKITGRAIQNPFIHKLRPAVEKYYNGTFRQLDDKTVEIFLPVGRK